MIISFTSNGLRTAPRGLDPFYDSSVSYRVKIRLKGRPQVTETFARKSDARIWAQRKHELSLLAESDRRNRGATSTGGVRGWANGC